MYKQGTYHNLKGPKLDGYETKRRRTGHPQRAAIGERNIYMEALVQLLFEKGIITKDELLRKIKQVQMGMVKSEG